MILSLFAAASQLALRTAPLSPDRDDAREWAERELSDPAYDVAEPTVLDRIARSVGDFIQDLFGAQLPDAWAPGFALIAGIVVIALLVVAVLVWGRPRGTARVRRAAGDLFGEHEERSAAALRSDAEAAARRGEWNEAIVLRFRAVARGLAERTIVETTAGTTVHAFAREAARAFPGSAARMNAAASAFDDVRYLRRQGTEDAYRAIATLDEELGRSRPALVEIA